MHRVTNNVYGDASNLDERFLEREEDPETHAALREVEESSKIPKYTDEIWFQKSVTTILECYVSCGEDLGARDQTLSIVAAVKPLSDIFPLRSQRLSTISGVEISVSSQTIPSQEQQ